MFSKKKLQSVTMGSVESCKNLRRVLKFFSGLERIYNIFMYRQRIDTQNSRGEIIYKLIAIITQYHRLIWPADIWLAQDIVLRSIVSYNRY